VSGGEMGKIGVLRAGVPVLVLIEYISTAAREPKMNTWITHRNYEDQ